MYKTLIIQLCQGKDSFPFYGTFKINGSVDIEVKKTSFVTLKSVCFAQIAYMQF